MTIIIFMKNFTKNYNRLMSVEAFSDDPFSSQGNPIIIYPLNSLDSLEKSFIACQELDQKSGVPLYMIYKPVIEQPSGRKEVITKIYLNSDLQGAERNHYLERAMLHYLGFPGQTYSYPDSVFFYSTQSNVDLIRHRCGSSEDDVQSRYLSGNDGRGSKTAPPQQLISWGLPNGWDGSFSCREGDFLPLLPFFCYVWVDYRGNLQGNVTGVGVSPVHIKTKNHAGIRCR